MKRDDKDPSESLLMNYFHIGQLFQSQSLAVIDSGLIRWLDFLSASFYMYI